jgi:hypothetical protein
VKLLALGDL